MKDKIRKELKKQKKALDRYLRELKEAQKGRLTKAKESQILYSYPKANEALAICDVLEELLK